ncbi:MAG TPA: GWxTD domain-containing protein [Chryseosolibacter sp.]|nr:GWxTD domain-containing protein [Chryseosolibacter sp.]
MKRNLCIVLLFLSAAAPAQTLRDINYSYVYNPEEPLTFELKAIRGDRFFTILYSLEVKDTANLMNEYTIHWEGRSLLSDKEGVGVVLKEHSTVRTGSGLTGRAMINLDAPRHIVAKVVKSSSKRAWLFYTSLEPNLPLNNFLIRNGSAVIEDFVHTNEKVKLAYDSGEWIVSYYEDNFPPAAPAFSEALARVSRGMKIDSVYTITAGEEVNFPKKGLYLIQKDTISLEGLAFRAEEDYPQYSKIVNLPGPLIYISTRQEYDRLELSQGNKKAFDRVVLSITVDTERARTLMRSYFRRVELANRYFTSYKEGWKTDRGMIYIIFGRPNEVFRFNDREVWEYKNSHLEGRFTFSKSSSLFDPDNFVLIREKKYESKWYEVIDLWRNARF